MVSARGSSYIRHVVWCLATTPIIPFFFPLFPSPEGLERGLSAEKRSSLQLEPDLSRRNALDVM